MTGPADRGPVDDDELVATLGHALDDLDPVPADAVAAARAAIHLGRVDEALADLLFDSLLDEPEMAMRSDHMIDTRSLAFEASSHRLDLELLGDGRAVLGQVDPAVAVAVELLTAFGSQHAKSDELGRFRFADVRGPMRLRVHLPDGSLLTPWITW